MLFTHLYLMQGEKIEAWFVSPASREYFGVESTAFLSASKFTKKLPTGNMKKSVNSSVFMLCYSSEITQNMVFQLLKNFKVEINFEWSHLDKSIFWLFAYIRKSSKRISASSLGVKFLIKELLCTHIASQILPNS